MNFPELWSPEIEARIRAEAKSLDPYRAPDNPQMCTRCVMTNARPRITFDEDGICNACRYAEHEVDWDVRKKQLERLLDRHRKTSGYDCIVPCSGGKDSSTVAWRLKNEWGMNPLCVKWAPFIETEIGRKNLEALSHHGFDIVECIPNGLLHRRLARLAFEYLGDHFQPFVYGQLAFPMRMAADLKINLVFGAENGEAAYGGDTQADNRRAWDYDDWERVYLKGHGIHRLLVLGQELGAFTQRETMQLSRYYMLPDRESLDWIEYHWLAHYLPHHPQGNYYFASEHTGFKANPERNVGTYSKYASIDDGTDDFHYWLAYAKFGIGRCTSDAAQEVRNGDLTSAEALKLVERYDGEFPSQVRYDLFKDYLGLSDGQFWRVVERFRGPQVSLDCALSHTQPALDQADQSRGRAQGGAAQ